MIKSLLSRMAWCFAVCVLSSTGLAQTVYVHCGELLAVPGTDPATDVTVILLDGTIDRIEQGFVEPGDDEGEDVEVIDLREKFVMPGLFDCHTHLSFELPPMAGRLRRSLVENQSHAAIDGTVFARRTLMAGFTTARNVGSLGPEIYALRDRIAQGMIVGPRILAAGKSISVTGGHADPTNGISPILAPAKTASEGVADGPYEMRKAVRERVKQGSDLIKITATGGVLSNTAAGVDQQMFDDEIRNVVVTARTMGRKVAAHAHGTNGINSALRAGVDSIEHGTYLDDESIRLFNETGAYLVPTIHAGKFVAEKSAFEEWFNPAIRAKASTVGPQIQDSVRRAHAGGVKIAFGTDVGVGAHGTNALEFVYMHEAGMSAMDCLVAATVNAADLCGVSNTLGTIEPGKIADIIAVDSSPLDDIGVMQDVGFVMKAGKVFKNE